MTDTDTNAQGQQENLPALRMTELRAIAAKKGIRGISAMRKHELIAAIQGHGGGAPAQQAPAKRREEPAGGAEDRGGDDSRGGDGDRGGDDRRGGDGDRGGDDRRGNDGDRGGDDRRGNDGNRGGDDRRGNDDHRGGGNDNADGGESRSRSRRNRRNRNRGGGDQGGGQNQGNQNQGGSGEGNQNQGGGGQGGRNRNRGDQGDGGPGGGRRNRRNRRDRRGRDGSGGGGGDEIREDDVLQQVAGIVDVLDNGSGFVRTSGYLPGHSDVYVSQNNVRKYGLRKGDAVVGQVRMPRDGSGAGQVTHGSGRNKRKYNPLVRVDSVNGLDPEQVKNRAQFSRLTPLYPNQRLRLETDPKILTTRVIDLIMPIGKGQRALIVSPPKAGKTTIMQNIANAIATNNPECYLMVVLVDERPEEVTDMQRSVRGEVIASTFDRPPSDHTAVAELAIERAKRLVEQGKDVVVLLDSITRLGRAYNNSSPASGRILSGGVDSNALYPPKRFLGAARNIEEGGSLTIVATAMVETGSAGDMVIFEEFKGTGNAELKLDRRISERRVFPAVDVNPSGTRKDELLLGLEESRVMHKLRRILSALDPQDAIDLLIKQLKKTPTNREFLAQVASSAPMAADVDVDDMV